MNQLTKKSLYRKPMFSSKEDVFLDTIIIVLCVFIGCICLYPFIYTISVSFSDSVAVTKGQVWLLPKGINLNSYKMLLKHPNLVNSYANTIFYTAAGTLWSMIMTTMAAFALSKRYLIGKTFFSYYIVFTMIFSGGLIPTFLVVTKLGLYNSRAAIILVGAMSAWNLIIMRTFMQSIPVSLKESARIDGANDWTIFLKIYLPLSKPAISIVTLFYAVAIWNDFFSSLIYLYDESKFPVQLIIRSLVVTMNDAMGSSIASSSSAGQFAPLSFKSAVVVVTMFPIMVIYPFIQKYFAKGIMVGAVKG